MAIRIQRIQITYSLIQQKKKKQKPSAEVDIYVGQFKLQCGIDYEHLGIPISSNTKPWRPTTSPDLPTSRLPEYMAFGGIIPVNNNSLSDIKILFTFKIIASKSLQIPKTRVLCEHFVTDVFPQATISCLSQLSNRWNSLTKFFTVPFETELSGIPEDGIFLILLEKQTLTVLS